MPRLPHDITSASRLCDWLEITALCAADGNASLGDLESALTVASYGETEDDSDVWESGEEVDEAPSTADPRDDERIEKQGRSVAEEVDERATAAPDAYPFTLSGTGVLRCRSRWVDFPAYTFCLVLCNHVERTGEETRTAARLFELLATAAAKDYVCGEAFRFGFPRLSPVPRGFSDALAHLVRVTGEGECPSDTPVGDSKDDGLDIVAWRPFSDSWQGRMMLFGQCSIAQRWNSTPKPKELDIDGFCRNWLRKQPFSTPARSFFTPAAVTSLIREQEERFVRYCGILFDRCRIAQAIGDQTRIPQAIVDWTGAHLKESAKLRAAGAR